MRLSVDVLLSRAQIRPRVVKLVDTGDLKSPAHCERAGSSPAPGTIFARNPLAELCVRDASWNAAMLSLTKACVLDAATRYSSSVVFSVCCITSTYRV